MKIGIISGSFNPIHVGHLIMAVSAYNSGEFDKILFVISNNPAKKNHPDMAAFSDRAEMVKLSIEDISNDMIDYSTVEEDMGSSNYTFNMLEKLQKEYPDDKLSLILGQDVVYKFNRWYKAREYNGKYSLYYVERPCGVVSKIFNDNVKNFGFKQLSMPHIDISSISIRKSVKEAKNIKFSVTDKVLEYIKSQRLYL